MVAEISQGQSVRFDRERWHDLAQSLECKTWTRTVAFPITATALHMFGERLQKSRRETLCVFEHQLIKLRIARIARIVARLEKSGLTSIALNIARTLVPSTTMLTARFQHATREHHHK